jgi:hypothetical protein
VAVATVGERSPSRREDETLEEVIRNGEEEGREEEGHEEEGREEEEVSTFVWTWHVLRGLVGGIRWPIPDCCLPDRVPPLRERSSEDLLG